MARKTARKTASKGAMVLNYAELERRVAALEKNASASLRFGKVTSVDGGQARVEIADGQGVVSHTLPTIQRRVLQDQEIKMPDIGEPVAVLFSGKSDGQEDGLILGAVYSPQAADPGQPQHMEYARFADGTELSYDRESHKLYVSVQGEIEVLTTKKISVKTKADIDVQAEGKVSVTAQGDIEATTLGNLTAQAVGNVHATAGAEAKIEAAAGITLKAPVIKICGLLSVTDMDGNPGKGVLQGDYVIRKGGLEVPDKDVTAGAVSLRQHVHEHSGGTGLSGTPQGG